MADETQEASASPVLYNVGTRAPDAVPDDKLNEALATGTHSYPAGTPVSLKAPDGSYATIPSENVQWALGQGYKVFTGTDAAVDQAVRDNKGVMGTAKVFASQFADQLGMGLPELIYSKTGDPLQVAKYEAIKKDHDAANVAGNVLGFGASLPLLGPVFKGAGAVGGFVEKQIATRLAADAAATGASAGVRSFTGVARDIASNLVAKTAGGAVEGAALFAPHAVTEAVLGDPQQAGEVLLSGLGIGGLLGAGGVAAKGFLNLGKSSLEKMSSLAGEAPLTAQKAAQVGAETLTGVKGEYIPKYLENPERINAAPTIEDTKDLIDGHIAGFGQKMDEAKLGAQNAAEDHAQNYKFALQDLRKQTAPESLRNQILTDMDAQKGVLGDLSDKADEALANSGQKFSKQEILDFIDGIGKSVGAGKEKALIGDEAVKAVAKLENMSERIKTGLSEDIDGQTLRDVLQQVRKDINWNTMAGEFSETSNKLKQNFTEGLSDILKEKVPEYKEIMDQMRPVSRNLGEMSKFYGNPQRADSTLERIMGPKAKTERAALQTFSDINGKNYFQDLESLSNSRELLAKNAAGVDISEHISPGTFGRMQKAQQALKDVQEQYQPLVKKLTPNRTQSIVTRQGYQNASIEDRRALESLSKITGDNFGQKIEDRHILDSFDKRSMQGSRKTMAGFALGNMIGGPVGGAIGAAAGAGMDIYSGKMLKAALDKRPDISGLLFVEQKMKAAAHKLDEIPDILDRMTKNLPAKPKSIGLDLADALIKHKEKEADLSKGSKHASMAKLRDEMASLGSNPAKMNAMLASYSSPISSGGAPQIGNAFNQKLAQSFNYLFGELPKPPRANSPFAPQVTYRPSDQVISAFMQKLQVVQDPWSVLNDLQSGTLTMNHMKALQAVYPMIHQRIQQKVQEHVIDGKAKAMPYQSRIKLSLLMGAPMDTSMNNQSIAAYQNSFAVEDQSVDKESGKPVNLSTDAMTDVQRMQKS